MERRSLSGEQHLPGGVPGSTAFQTVYRSTNIGSLVQPQYHRQQFGGPQLHSSQPGRSVQSVQGASGSVVAMHARQFAPQPQAGQVLLPGLQTHDAALASDYNAGSDSARGGEELRRIQREHEAEQKRTIQKHQEEMVTVTESLESLQRVIVDQRTVIEKLRDASRPSGEPFDELKREMKAMEQAHEARLKQEQERSKRLEQQLSQGQGSGDIEETLAELRAEMDAISAAQEEQYNKEHERCRELEEELQGAHKEVAALRSARQGGGGGTEALQVELAAVRLESQAANKKLADEMARAKALQEQVGASQAEAAAAQKRIEQLEQTLAEKADSQLRGSAAPEAEEKARRVQAEKELAGMRAEVAKMQEERVTMREQHMKKVQALDAMRESLHSEIRLASGQSAVNAEALELQEEIRNLRKRSVEDAKKLRAECARVHELETAIQDMKREGETGMRALQQNVQRCQDLQAQLFAANKQVTSLEILKGQMEIQLQDFKALKKNEERAAEMDKQAQAKMHELAAQHQQEMRKLNEILEREKARELECFEDLLAIASKGPEGGEAPAGELSRDDLRAKLLERLSKSTDANQYQRAKARIQDHMRNARSKSAPEMQKQLEDLLLALSASEAEAERRGAELAVLRSEKTSYVPELERLRVQVGDMTKRIEEEDHDKLRRMQEALRAQKLVSELREKNSVLQQEVESQESAAALALKRLQDQHEDEIDKLTQQHIDDMGRMHERVFQLEGREGQEKDVLEGRDALTVQTEVGVMDEQERQRFKGQLDALSRKCEWFEKEVNEKAEEVMRLEDGSSALADELGKAHKEVEGLKKQLVNLEVSNKTLEAQLSAAQAQLDAAEKLDAAKKQMEQNDSKVDASLLAKSKDDLLQTQKELAKCKDALLQAQQGLKECKAALSGKEKELTEALVKLATQSPKPSPLLQAQEKKELFMRVEMLKSELLALQRQTEAASANDAELRSRLKVTEAEREMYVTECLKLQKEILRLNQDRDNKGVVRDENESSAQPQNSNKGADRRHSDLEEDKTKLLAQLSQQMSLYHEERRRSEALEHTNKKLRQDFEMATGKRWALEDNRRQSDVSVNSEDYHVIDE